MEPGEAGDRGRRCTLGGSDPSLFLSPSLFPPPFSLLPPFLFSSPPSAPLLCSACVLSVPCPPLRPPPLSPFPSLAPFPPLGALVHACTLSRYRPQHLWPEHGGRPALVGCYSRATGVGESEPGSVLAAPARARQPHDNTTRRTRPVRWLRMPNGSLASCRMRRPGWLGPASKPSGTAGKPSSRRTRLTGRPCGSSTGRSWRAAGARRQPP